MSLLEIDDLAGALGQQLAGHAWQLATAESCTGGWVSAAVTAIAGSSAWFDRGFVTYSNEAKQEMLGVPAAVIASHGAVSEQTAAAMAAGALAHSCARIAVSITGVSGPGGGCEEKPVGTVCFGWAVRADNGAVSVTTETHHFSGDRTAVRQQSVVAALRGLTVRIPV